MSRAISSRLPLRPQQPEDLLTRRNTGVGASTLIQTERLNLVSWREDHREPFAGMHAERAVTLDLGGPMSRVESDAKFDRYRAAQAEHGLSRWAVESRGGTFLGYAGVMLRHSRAHPLGQHAEIGWRFVRDAWSRGLATESARAALEDAFRCTALDEIFSYAGADNLRSQAVMSRLRLRRDCSRDFAAEYKRVGVWHGLVWIAARPRIES